MLASFQSYLSRRAGKWHAVYPASIAERTPPRQHGATEIAFDRGLALTFPEIGVVELPRATLAGPSGWVICEDGTVLADSSWYGTLDVMPQVPRSPRRRRRLRGVCISVASEWADANYAHFVLDCLPRLHLIAQAGYALEEIDFVYIPRPPSPKAERLLARLNIPPSKYIWASGDELVDVDTLIVSSFPGVARNYPSWVPRYLRSTFVDQPGHARRRVFLRRRGRTRNLQNEDTVLRVLEEHEVHPYHHTQVLDEPAFFAEIACVIAPHDPGLANIAFCSAGARVLELIPTDHVQPYYFTLADAAGLTYGYLAARSAGARPPGSWGPSPFDFHVDEQELADALRAFLGNDDPAPARGSPA